jgi:hypothetical protein
MRLGFILRLHILYGIECPVEIGNKFGGTE